MTETISDDSAWQEELQAEYRKSLQGKLLILTRLVTRLVEHPEDLEVFEALRTCVHKIHGSAGSFGLERLSQVAGEWERQLDLMLPEPSIAMRRDSSNLSLHLERLRACAELPPETEPS